MSDRIDNVLVIVGLALVALLATWVATGQRNEARLRADSLCAYVLKSASASDSLAMHKRFGCNLEGSR